MSAAPSEKHLEDWIVNNPLRFGDLWDADMAWPGSENYYWPDEDTFISPWIDTVVERQCRLPHGIADVVGYSLQQLYVVEIKKGPVTYATLGQCLRYVYDMRQIYYWAYMDAPLTLRRMLETKVGNHWEDTEWPDAHIGGIVVGHGMEDANMPIVAAAAKIMVITYDYKGDNYTFEHQGVDCVPSVDTFRKMSNGRLGDYMRLVMAEEYVAKLTREQRDQKDNPQ